MGINQKVILYFDDFGAREAEEKYGLDNNIMETALCDGTNRYTLVYKDKSVINNGACPRGVAYRFDWNEVSKADPKYKPQKLSDISIAGKNCESFSLETSGNTVIYAGWNNICFLIDQNTQFGKMTYKAIAFEENVSVPEEKLKVPAGFQIK
jgi:Zn/Cd-binding protein ZinT